MPGTGHCQGTEIFRRERLPALLEVLDLYTSCDIICLQEVEIGQLSQVARLGNMGVSQD